MSTSTTLLRHKKAVHVKVYETESAKNKHMNCRDFSFREVAFAVYPKRGRIVDTVIATYFPKSHDRSNIIS